MNILEFCLYTKNIYVPACKVAWQQSVEELNKLLNLNVPIEADFQVPP